jgi:hypothetical protein
MGKITKTQKSQQLVGDQERESRRDPHANTRPRLPGAEPRTPGVVGRRSQLALGQPMQAADRGQAPDEQDGGRRGRGEPLSQGHGHTW